MAKPKYKVGDFLFFTNDDGAEQVSEVSRIHEAASTYQFRAMGHYGGFITRGESDVSDISLRDRIARIEKALGLG